jgi:hypothetical protein
MHSGRHNHKVPTRKFAAVSGEILTATFPMNERVLFRPRFASVGKRLNELLAGPACGRVVCHVEMHDTPAIMGKNDEDKQDSKGGGGNHEKVDGDQVLDVIVQESALCPGRRVSLFWYQSGHGPFRDLDPEFQKFPVDSQTSPSRIGIGHFTDQLADFFACSWPTGSAMF